MIEAEVFIQRLADCAEAVGEQAGVGAMEVAGSIVSYLAAHPEWLGAFMKQGYFGLPADFMERGDLTWQADDGKVWHPRDARLARVVKSMAPERAGKGG